MLLLSKFKDYIRVPKLWGEEIHLVNRPEYCSKFLILKDGFQCSLHRHPKTETFFILDGSVNLEIQTGLDQKFKQVIRLDEGESYHIPPMVFHRFSTAKIGGALILEVSTTHHDMDVERLEDSREI